MTNPLTRSLAGTVIAVAITPSAAAPVQAAITAATVLTVIIHNYQAAIRRLCRSLLLLIPWGRIALPPLK